MPSHIQILDAGVKMIERRKDPGTGDLNPRPVRVTLVRSGLSRPLTSMDTLRPGRFVSVSSICSCFKCLIMIFQLELHSLNMVDGRENMFSKDVNYRTMDYGKFKPRNR